MVKGWSTQRESSQDSSVSSALDWYLEGPGFKSCRLQLNFQLEKGCGRDSMQYAINYGCVELNLNNIKCSVRGYVHVVYCKAAYKDPQNFWCWHDAQTARAPKLPLPARSAHRYPQGWFNKIRIKFVMFLFERSLVLSCFLQLSQSENSLKT